jgi:hypothetical protein
VKDAKFWIVAILVALSIGTVESNLLVSAGCALAAIIAVLLIRGDEA